MRNRSVLLAMAVCLVGACGDAPDVKRSAAQSAAHTSAPPESFAWNDLPEGWSELAPSPVVARPAARAWMGDELFVWSGYTYEGGTAGNEGAVYSPDSNSWTRTSPSPIAGRYGSAAVWTGAEVVIWGGISDSTTLDDGAAYNPETDTWRLLPNSPLSARSPVAAVWTGTEMIISGSRDRPDPESDGAAYNPTTNDWRAIAPAPIEINLGTGVWTGTEMLVYGSLLDDNNHSDLGRNEGAAYDPVADEWRVVPSTDLSPQATTLAWTGERAIAWDYELESMAYKPLANSWDDIPDLPLDFSECYPSSVAIRSSVFAWFCGRAALFDDVKSRWIDVSPNDPRLQPTSDVVAPVAAGSVVLLPGIRGADESVMWAYKPPTDGPDDRDSESRPDCGVISLAGDEYGTTITPDHGPPGTTVTLSGTTLRAGDGRWTPADRLEAWWNTTVPASEVPGGSPIRDGPVLELVEVDDMRTCEFETELTVPDVEPGTWTISIFVWNKEGYGEFLPHEFVVE